MNDAVAAKIKVEESAVPGDEALIARVAAGDERSFRLLADRYTGLFFSLAYRMGYGRAGAEDIVQETLLRLWQKAGEWDPQRGASVRTWLCRIATNLCIDGKRRTTRETGGEAPEQADPAAGAYAMIETQETGAIVGLALKKLSDRQRSALILFHYEGMPVKEIALVLKTTPKGAERLLDRARGALRQGLQSYKGVL